MVLLRTFGRLLVLVFSVSLAPAILGLLLGGVRGLIMGLLFGIIGMLLTAFFSENGLLRAIKALPVDQPALQKTYELACQEIEDHLPQLALCPWSVPQVVLIQGLTGSGYIVVTQGLLNSLEEKEIRAILRTCVYRTQHTALKFQTLCAWLAHLLFSLLPAAWSAVFFDKRRLPTDKQARLTPSSFMIFAALYPILKTLTSLGSPQRLSPALRDAPLRDQEHILQRARDKIFQCRSSCSSIDTPALRHLLIIDTQAANELLENSYDDTAASKN